MASGDLGISKAHQNQVPKENLSYVESKQDSLPETGDKGAVSKKMSFPIWGERLLLGVKVAGLGIGCVVSGAIALVLLPLYIPLSLIAEKVSGATKAVNGTIGAPIFLAIASGNAITRNVSKHELLEMARDLYQGTITSKTFLESTEGFHLNQRLEVFTKIRGLKLENNEKMKELEKAIFTNPSRHDVMSLDRDLRSNEVLVYIIHDDSELKEGLLDSMPDEALQSIQEKILDYKKQYASHNPYIIDRANEVSQLIGNIMKSRAQKE